MPRGPRVVDSDVDLHDPAQQRELGARQWDLLLATSMGGILGAWGRYGLGVAMPSGARGFPWATLVVNISGCLLIGALMVVLLDLGSPHRLARPFLGVGVLGGYTTYSTFAVDVERLVRVHRPLLALAYAAATLIGCAAAVWLSTAAVGRIAGERRTVSS